MQKSVNFSPITSAPLRRVPKVRCVLLLLFLVSGLFAQQGLPFDDWTEVRGDPAVAERYQSWIENAIAEGQWARALTALERAGDFADVSSDISYLYATVLVHENRSKGSILRALGQAIAAGKWNRYSEADARLLQVRQFIAIRRYQPALESLAVRGADVGDDADSAVLRLEALKGLVLSGASLPSGRPAAPVPVEFRRRLLETMDRYPRDSRPLRILFGYAAEREPTGDDIALITLALRRLPFLLETDGELAWMAAPFIADVAEARRLVGSYRSGSLLTQAGSFRPSPGSLVPALNLGLLDDFDAVEELLDADTLDKDIVLGIGKLLRHEEGRDAFVRGLHAFTGTITEDEDKDGIYESRAVYRQGVLVAYRYDADQDGLDEMVIVFDSGAPRNAEIAALPAASPPAQPIPHAQIYWERYPSVERIVLGNDTYLFPPGGFLFSPIEFEELCASGNYAGLLFPRRDSLNPGLTRRMLSSFASSVQRPSAEFEGGVEHIYLEGGIPHRAEVILDGMVVSVTEFENGIPVIQRVDLLRNGRMETIRHFDRGSSLPGSSASDWDGDGIFEYREVYREDGSVVNRWELLEGQ